MIPCVIILIAEEVVVLMGVKEAMRLQGPSFHCSSKRPTWIGRRDSRWSGWDSLEVVDVAECLVTSTV